MLFNYTSGLRLLSNPAVCYHSFNSLVWIPAVLVWCSAFLTIFVNSLIVPFVSVLTFLNGCLFSTVAVSLAH